MVHPTRPDAGFVAIVTFRTEGPSAQQALVAKATGGVQDWIRTLPGFISATYHVSADGLSVVNYAQWTSAAAYQESFATNPRAAELRAELGAVPGLTGPPSSVFCAPAGSIEREDRAEVPSR